MSDSLRMLSLLREYQDAGVHSLDLRSYGVSGNPSQRAKDLVTQGHGIATKRERRGRTNGSRYWLREFAPPDATRVKGNHETDIDVELDAGTHPVTGRSPGVELGVDSELRLVCDATDRRNIRFREERIAA